MPFNPDVLALFRLAYPSRAGTEIESAELPYTVRFLQAEYGAETEDLAETSDAAAAAGVRPPRPSNWEIISKDQKEMWMQHGGRLRGAKGHGGT